MSITHSEDKEKLFAYHTIHDFFDIYILEDAITYLQSILKAAGSNKVWKKNYPFSVLHYIQQLDKLCSAAFYIHEHFAQRAAAIMKKDKRTNDPAIELLQTSMSKRVGETFWNSFPPHITLQQFYDPYLAIKSFCRYMPQTRWQEALKDIQEYALMNSTISDLHPAYNLLNIQRHLARLIEACHLLEVRTNRKLKEGKNEEIKE